MPPVRTAALILMLVAGGAVPLAAQAGVVRGTVIRADQPVGLGDAEVVLRPSGARTRSDPRGRFEFHDLPAGRAEVAVHRVGFAPAVVVLQVDGLSAVQIEISLEPVAALLDPIVTSATRDQRSLSQVAAAVSVVDGSAIRRNQTVGLQESLRMMPGVEAVSRYGTDDVNLGIRGSASRNRQAMRGVALLLDGIPITESDGLARPDLIELAASRQIEVVRGPSSALYAGSAGGVVNVVSRSGRDSPGFSVAVREGGFGFRKYDVHGGGMMAGGRGSGFAATSYTTADGYRAHSDANVLRGQAAFDVVAGPGTRVAIDAQGSRLDSRLPGSLTQPQFDADPLAAAPAALAFGFGRGDARYRVGARVEQAVTVGTASGYVFYGGRTLDYPVPTQIVDLNLHRLQGGARFRADRVADVPVDVTFGVDYDDVFGTDHRWVNDGGARGALRDDGYFSVPNLGAYSQVEWQVARPVDVTLGLRYDRVAYRFESYVAGAIPRQQIAFDQLSPRLSALWTRDSATSFYASLGRGFEVPVIAELSSSPGDPLQSAVRPKSLWNYEVGARRTIDTRMRLEAALFYADVRGEFVPISVDGQPFVQNASRSRNLGVELGVGAHASRRVDFGASYAFLDLRLRRYSSAVLDSTGALRQENFDGKILPAVPRHRITGEARVRPLAAIDVGIQVEWQSVVYVETSNAGAGVWYFRTAPGAPVQRVPFRAVPARTLVHLDGAWRLGTVRLFGSVENLFGVRYAGNIVANESFGRFYETGSPARVSLGVSFTGWGAARTTRATRAPR